MGLASMLFSDRVIFDWLKAAAGTEREITLKPSEIANGTKCHRHTIRNATNRLEALGYIEVERTSKRDGYVYRVLK